MSPLTVPKQRACFAVAVALAATAFGSPAGLSKENTPLGLERGTTFGPGGWSYFADPRALRYRGVDHAGWVTPGGKIQVGALAGGGVRVWTLARGLGRNDHSSPALTVLPDGRLAVFWSPHSRAPSPDSMFYRVLRGRRDSWGPA